ncbi:MAG: methyltransferase domain-containing protein [Chitinophagaceae bacterium]
MKVYRIKSFGDYKRHAERNGSNYQSMVAFQNSFIKPAQQEFTVKAISYPANQQVDLKVDYLYADGNKINWRERLICPVTGLNNRLRASVHVMDMEIGAYPDSRIYITEQVTPLFSFLEKRYPGLVGSEYLSPDIPSGTVINEVRHEDMRNLSFADSSLDHYLSFECFEHIPFYELAITEIYRTLKPDGFFMGTFPFDVNAPENKIKARLEPDGTITHLTEPEYHGDPVNGKGILCFTIFGWELLDQFRQAGFKDVYMLMMWSDVYGYLGGEQTFFIARK